MLSIQRASLKQTLKSVRVGFVCCIGKPCAAGETLSLRYKAEPQAIGHLLLNLPDICGEVRHQRYRWAIYPCTAEYKGSDTTQNGVFLSASACHSFLVELQTLVDVVPFLHFLFQRFQMGTRKGDQVHMRRDVSVLSHPNTPQ